MRVGAIADLHIRQETSTEFLRTLIDVCQEMRIDCLLIAGDISEDVNLTIEYVNELNTGIKTLYVPGNHDLWNRYNQLPIEEIYERFSADPNCLLNKSYMLTDKVEVIGHIGWYDYSLGACEEYSKSELDGMTIDGRTWNDKQYNSWTDNNIEVCNRFNEELKSLLSASDHQKILLTHMISNPGFKVLFDEQRSNKGFFNSYLGSYDLYRLTIDNNISHAICGHVHYRKTIVDNQVKYLCPCLGGEQEWSRYHRDVSLRHQLQTCIEVIEL